VANERNIDILLLTEPYYLVYQQKVCAPGWDAVCGPRSAILVRKDIIHSTQPLACPDMVAMCIGDTLVVCSYVSPSEDHTGLFSFLQQLTAGNSLGIVPAGDFNCTTSLIPGYQTCS